MAWPMASRWCVMIPQHRDLDLCKGHLKFLWKQDVEAGVTSVVDHRTLKLTILEEKSTSIPKRGGSNRGD